jgi:predicted nucleotidyltransferase component of viral defense system
VEQDLIISRALVALFSDEFLSENLAFRGGTALHKLYLNPAPLKLLHLTGQSVKLFS